ncbi:MULTISPECIES: hypothetical protein [Cysteiniphilum]|uniref:hypothetical protein n=1 Tax=Cysteiniphilum TaxID=2056696 RepID=UPI00177BF75E|nr:MULTISPECIES: hypothetical protein [Cysteiniphilum]
MILSKKKSNQVSKAKKVRFRRTKKMFLAESFKKQHVYLTSMLKKVFMIKKPKSNMSYEDLPTIGVDHKKQVKLIKRFTLLYRVCMALAIIDYFYALYLLIYADGVLVSFVCFSLLLLILANAFKYHFWRYQLLRKKLGCSFKEWALDLVSKRSSC